MGLSKARVAVSRSIDVAVSLAGFVLVAPVLVLTSLAIRLAMGSPVLFRQERAGRAGRPFVLVKFRTMRPAAAGEEGSKADGARLTRLGRILRSTSIDELPTLWNVLKGDMTLVGPRPLLMRYLSRYTARQARRLDVKPGITGLTQVSGRNSLTWEQKFDLDVWYVEHRSLSLDVRILFRTVAKVVRREGIAGDGHATMPEFGGLAEADAAPSRSPTREASTHGTVSDQDQR